MKKAKRKAAVLIVAMIAGLFGGCSSLPEFDASKYVGAILDAAFKNDTTLAEELKLEPREEIDKLYDDLLNIEVSNTFGNIKVSEDIKQRYYNIYKDVFSKLDYTVKDSQKLSDGSYSVTVTYRKMNLFRKTWKKVRKNLNKMNNTNAQLAFESMNTLMADSLEKTLAKDMEYGIEEVMIIHVELKRHMYDMNYEDIQKLVKNLTDADEFSKELQSN